MLSRCWDREQWPGAEEEKVQAGGGGGLAEKHLAQNFLFWTLGASTRCQGLKHGNWCPQGFLPDSLEPGSQGLTRSFLVIICIPRAAATQTPLPQAFNLFLFYLCVYLFLAVLGPCCCMGFSLVVMHWLLLVLASPDVEQRL